MQTSPFAPSSHVRIATLAAALAMMLCAVAWGGDVAKDARPESHKAGATREVEIGKGQSIELVWCPPGEFEMGSPVGELGRCDDEGPRHHVTLTKGYWIGKYEVTIAQWVAVMGKNPCRDAAGNLPVNRVSWTDCQAFVQKLSKKTGVHFRLPTEAEWEYACRAGTSTPFAGEKGGLLCWHIANSDRRNHAVGTKKPNPWGIYDMHGNVWEWCQDLYDPYSEESVVDPTGPKSGEEYIYRGGCSWRPMLDSRSAFRNYDAASYKQGRLGLRVVVVP